MKTMTAKFAGVCECCGQAFPKGTTIVYNGRASHVECVADEAAKQADQDRIDAERHAAHTKAFNAGELIKVTQGGDELMVTCAPTYEMAKKAAFDYLRTLPEGAVILRKTMKSGKKYLGREVVSGGAYGGMTYHEGWAFRYRVAPATVTS